MALKTVTNAAAITFPKATGGGPETEAWVGIGTAASGAGVLLFRKQLTSNLVVNTNVQPQFAAGELDIANTGDITEALCEKILDLLFNNEAATGIGDAGGLLPSAAAGNLYVSLHTADPGAGGDQTTNEAAYTSYARVAVARTVAGWTVA